MATTVTIEIPREEVKAAKWIRVASTKNHELVQALRQDLDAGEAEAIVLALELGAELLRMDEQLGRESARHLGARCVGLIGVLIEAKRKGFIGSIKPLLGLLRTAAGFRVRESLYQRVLGRRRALIRINGLQEAPPQWPATAGRR